jgi:DNA-binding SARP family transcriptional activator/predicted ATPase
MARLQLSFLGSFHVEMDGRPVRSFRSTKVRALLAYLAIESGQSHQREALAGLLWPDESEDVARLNLRQSLYHLRKTLGDEERSNTTGTYLSVARHTVQFNLESDHWLDVTSLLGALERGEFEQAAALYRGDLLKGLSVAESDLFDKWLVITRARLHRLMLESLHQLTRHHQEQGDWAKSQKYAQQQLILEPWCEEAHRQLMWALAANGRRSAALTQYELCHDSLAEELGVEPEWATTALYEQIRTGMIGRPGETQTESQFMPPPAFELPRLPRRGVIGREPARSWLQGGLATAMQGHGLLLCVTGEPGIGKTLLVEDFLKEIALRGESCAVARGQCSERLAGAEAYLPWLEALDNLLRGHGGDWVAQVMKLLAPTWHLQLAEGSPDEAAAARLLERQALSSERMKRELYALMQELSRLQPLVLFFDDLHWADASTTDLLAYLGNKLATLRILVITAYRPSELWLEKHPFIQVKLELQGRAVCRELALEFWTAPDVENFLTFEFPDHRFPPQLAALIYSKTEGNPLFAVDLVRYLRDRAVIAQQQDGWGLACPIPDFERDLPESVASMIERKIAQVSQADQRLLVTASVQGYEFDSAVVAKALAESAMEVEERLEALERVYSFVRLVEEKELPDGTLTSQYRFVHVLYQNALYRTLRPTRKAQSNRAVAEALLCHHGEKSGAVASELAHLYEGGREFALAVDYYLMAAENAAHVFAHREAAILARRGLHLLKSLPDTPACARQELRLQLTLGSALSVTEGYAALETGECMARAQTICEEIGETSELFPAIWGLAVYYLIEPQYHKARALGEQLLRLAESNAMLLTGAHTILGFALLYLGELSKSLAHHEQATALRDPAQHRTYITFYGLDPGLYSISNTIRLLWLMGYPDQSKRRVQETVALARQAADPRSLAFALHLEVVFRLFYGEIDEALERAAECITLCEEQGIAQEREWTKVYYGWAITRQGQVEKGIDQMRQSIAELRRMHAENTFPHFLALLAEVLVQAGQIEEGRTALSEAFDIIQRTGDSAYEAEVYRIKGHLLLMGESKRQRAKGEDGGNEGAQKFFHKAIEIARRQGAKSLELRAAMSLCRWLGQQGRAEEGRERLAEVYRWFTEGFATGDLKEAEALLRIC